MAYAVHSINRVKRVAKDLKAALGQLGIARSYMACLDLVSRLYGHSDYRTFQQASLAVTARPSLDDDLTDNAETVSRRAHHVSVLRADGIESAVAEFVVDRIRPTGRALTAPKPRREAIHPERTPLLPFDAISMAMTGQDFRAIRTGIMEATRHALAAVRVTFKYDMGMVDALEAETARWAAVDADYAAPFRDGLSFNVECRCRVGRQYIELAAIGFARGLCDARASGEAMAPSSPDWREVISLGTTLGTVTDSKNWCMETAVVTEAERTLIAEALLLARAIPQDLDRTRTRMTPSGNAPAVILPGTVSADPQATGISFYIVEDDDTLTPLSMARYQRFTDGGETAPERAGKQFRIIDAYYVRDGRTPVRLSHCIGLYRSFDGAGRMIDCLPETLERMHAGMKARVWQVEAGHFAQVRRHLKLAA